MPLGEARDLLWAGGAWTTNGQHAGRKILDGVTDRAEDSRGGDSSMFPKRLKGLEPSTFCMARSLNQ